MYLPRKFKYLNENEIAGADTINPIVEFLRHIRTTDDFVDFNPNEGGGINLDVDRVAILEWIKKVYPHPTDDFSFKVTFNGTNFTCSGGKVYFPHTTLSVGNFTNPINGGGGLYLQIGNKASSISISRGTPSNMLDNSYNMQLPIADIYESKNEWKVKYYHMGDFFFSWVPAEWIEYYSKQDVQFLGHAQNGDVVWVTSTECPQNQQQ